MATEAAAAAGGDKNSIGEFLLVDEVKLTVGETVFITSLETLKADAPNKLQTVRVYRDRDPKYVGYILHYLRGHHSFLDAFSPVERLMLLDEAKYYGLNKLSALLEDNNEVKNARKITDALIPWRFELLRSARFKKWIEDDTWWTGLVSTMLQFDFFRAIMRSDSQTDSLLTLCNDIVTHISLAMDTPSSSSSSSSENEDDSGSGEPEEEDDDDDDDEDNEDDQYDLEEVDLQKEMMKKMQELDTKGVAPNLRSRRLMMKKHDNNNDQKQNHQHHAPFTSTAATTTTTTNTTASMPVPPTSGPSAPPPS